MSVKHGSALISFQADKEIKLAPKLSEAHIHPSHFDKMKVPRAMNFFSHAVLSGIQCLVQHEGFDKAHLTTAWFINLINKWFDLMSSRHPNMALSKFNSASNEETINYLQLVLNVFRNMHIGKSGHWKPVQTGVRVSTTTIPNLQNDFF